MRVYITTQGSKIVKEGDRLLVKKDNDVFHTMFIHKVKQIIIFGNVTITSPYISSKKVDLTPLERAIYFLDG